MEVFHPVAGKSIGARLAARKCSSCAERMLVAEARYAIHRSVFIGIAFDIRNNLLFSLAILAAGGLNTRRFGPECAMRLGFAFVAP